VHAVAVQIDDTDILWRVVFQVEHAALEANHVGHRGLQACQEPLWQNRNKDKLPVKGKQQVAKRLACKRKHP